MSKKGLCNYLINYSQSLAQVKLYLCHSCSNNIRDWLGSVANTQTNNFSIGVPLNVRISPPSNLKIVKHS